MRRRSLVALTFCCVLSWPAEAQEAPGLKSGRTAFSWSLLGTAVPGAAGLRLLASSTDHDEMYVTALVGASLIGPSLGHFYADRPGRALVGIGIRTLAAAGVAGYFFFNGMDDSAGTHSRPELGQALGAVGVAVGGASLTWDIVRAPHSARVHNDQVRGDRRAIAIAPSIGASGLGVRVDVGF